MTNYGDSDHHVEKMGLDEVCFSIASHDSCDAIVNNSYSEAGVTLFISFPERLKTFSKVKWIVTLRCILYSLLRYYLILIDVSLAEEVQFLMS